MNLPKDGWKYVTTIDLKSVCGNCGLCGTPIRYVHKIEHKDADIVLEIGCECASNVMSGDDLDYIKEQDKRIKGEVRNEAARIKRLQAKWQKRNEFYEKRGLPGSMSWEEYLAICEKKGD